MEEKSRVPALVRCMQILSYIENHKDVSIVDLVANLDIPKSSIYLLVDEIIKQRLITQNKQGKLQLWMRLIELGNRASQSLDLREYVMGPLDKLKCEIDCLAVHFGVMDGETAYYAVKRESPRAGVSIRSREGHPVSLVHAGLGKCLLAYQKEEIIEKILPKLDYTPFSKTSITTPEGLRAELQKIRNQGWAFDDSEGEADIRCVAAPVFDIDRNLIGAISIVGLVGKFTDDAIDGIVTCVKACAKEIENVLNCGAR